MHMLGAAMAAAMFMISGPSEAKMHAGKAGSSSESSQGGYDMTGKPIDALHSMYNVVWLLECVLNLWTAIQVLSTVA